MNASVTRNDNVGALDHVAENAAQREQGEGRHKGGFCRIGRNSAHRPQRHGAGKDKRPHVGVSPLHQLGEQLHVREGTRRHHQIHGSDEKQRSQGARRDDQRLAEVHGDPQPSHHHEYRMLELQDVAATPEDDLVIDFFLDPRDHPPRPEERNAPSCSGSANTRRGQVVSRARNTARLKPAPQIQSEAKNSGSSRTGM